MKKIILFWMFLCPLILFGQKIEFNLGGAINVTYPYLNDLINDNEPTIEDIQLNGGAFYGWSLSNGWLHRHYSRYRSTNPKIGATIKGIVSWNFSEQLSLRSGLQVQYTSYKRLIDKKAVSHIFPDRLSITLHDVHFETNEKLLYLSIPINLKYRLKNNKTSFFGGVMFSNLIFDNEELIDGKTSLKYNSGNVRINPRMIKKITNLNIGVNYKISEKINLEIEIIHSLGNMIFYDNVVKNLLENVNSGETVPNFNKEKAFLRQGSIGVSYKLF